MKKLSILIVIMIMGIAFKDANAQKIASVYLENFRKIPNYRIGEQIPDLRIEKIFQANPRSASAADFKDKLLIIDFWGTTCKSCVEALPKMQALQQQFGDKVKILPVTPEKEANVASFWKNNKYTKDLSIPTAVEDTVFHNYFPHDAVPHEVWIYKGKVIAITLSDYVDAANIQKVLDGQEINWPVMNYYYVFDPAKGPLFKPDTSIINNPGTLKYAVVSGYLEKDGAGIGGMWSNMGIYRDKKQKTVSGYFINGQIYNVYRSFFKIDYSKLIMPMGAMHSNGVVWEVADPSKYKRDEKLDKYSYEYLRKHGICFESQTADTGQTDEQVYQTMIADLNRLLGLNVRYEKRREKVLVLVGTNQEHKLVKRESLPEGKGMSVSTLAILMNEALGNPYVFDETAYHGDGVMDMGIPSWTDIPAIRKALQAYGLDLKEEERLVDKFVFTEVKK